MAFPLWIEKEGEKKEKRNKTTEVSAHSGILKDPAGSVISSLNTASLFLAGSMPSDPLFNLTLLHGSPAHGNVDWRLSKLFQHANSRG